MRLRKVIDSLVNDNYSTRYAIRVDRTGKSFFLIDPLCLIAHSAVMSNQVKKPAPEANFEQAMKRLEEIVEKMESGDLPWRI
jgi:hypothetical protein